MFTDILSQLFNNYPISTDDTTIRLLVPGYGKEDLILEQENNTLTIKDTNKDILKIIRIPNDIESIEAKCDKGILELKLNKSLENKKVIAIQ